MVGPLIFIKRHLSKSLAQVLPRKGRLGGTFLVEAGGATLEFLKCEGKSRKYVLFLFFIFFRGYVTVPETNIFPENGTSQKGK